MTYILVRLVPNLCKSETKMDIGFDLVKVPDMILDAKTFKKTIGELQLQNSTLNQVLRKYDSVEYQLRLISAFRSVPTVPKAVVKFMDTNHNGNVAALANNNVASASDRKRKNVAQSDPRSTKKTKFSNKSTTQDRYNSSTNQTPNSDYFTSQYQYYATFIERFQRKKNSF